MVADKKLTARVLSQRRAFDGFFKLDEYLIEADTHEGGTQQLTRLIFERGHAVAILGYDPNRDEVLLTTEMRAGILVAGDNPYTDALPAGGIEPGETPIDAAKREMLEETGQDLKTVFYIHAGAYSSPGGTSEKISLVCGILDTSKAGGIHGAIDEGENIKTVIMKADEFILQAESGKINNLKTLVAAFWLAKNKQRLRFTFADKPKAARRYIAKA